MGKQFLEKNKKTKKQKTKRKPLSSWTETQYTSWKGYLASWFSNVRGTETTGDCPWVLLVPGKLGELTLGWLPDPFGYTFLSAYFWRLLRCSSLSEYIEVN